MGIFHFAADDEGLAARGWRKGVPSPGREQPPWHRSPARYFQLQEKYKGRECWGHPAELSDASCVIKEEKV